MHQRHKETPFQQTLTLLLRELGFEGLAEIAESHFGITKDEAEKLGFIRPHDMLPKTLEAKIIFIADKIRPGRKTLKEILDYHKKSDMLTERYFNRCESIKVRCIKTIADIWAELEILGMKSE